MSQWWDDYIEGKSWSEIATKFVKSCNITQLAELISAAAVEYDLVTDIAIELDCGPTYTQIRRRLQQTKDAAYLLHSLNAYEILSLIPSIFEKEVILEIMED